MKSESGTKIYFGANSKGSSSFRFHLSAFIVDPSFQSRNHHRLPAGASIS
jgi:hypothetical protein